MAEWTAGKVESDSVECTQASGDKSEGGSIGEDLGDTGLWDSDEGIAIGGGGGQGALLLGFRD